MAKLSWALTAAALMGAGLPALASAGRVPPATVTRNGSGYTLANGFVSVIYRCSSLVSLRGDFEGGGNYGAELLAGTGFSLMSQGTGPFDRAVRSSSSSTWGSGAAATVQVISSGPALAAIVVSGVQAGAATESWSIGLSSGARSFELNTTGSTAATSATSAGGKEVPEAGGRVDIISHGLFATPISIYGFYPDDGVVQMRGTDKAGSFMPTNRPVARVYMIGGNTGGNRYTQGSIDISRAPLAGTSSELTMLVGAGGAVREAGFAPDAATGFIEVVAGGAAVAPSKLDSWSDPFAGPDTPGCHFRQTGGCSAHGSRQPEGDQPCNATIPCSPGDCPSGYCECADGQKKHLVSCKPGSHTPFVCADVCGLRSTSISWATSMSIAPNNRNFPAGRLTSTSPNLPTDDLAAIMTGIFGSAPGCLCTFPNSPACPGIEGKHEKLGQIATTIARPDRGYAGTYNYFDPDNFFSMTALIYSGESFLQEQARTVIERSGSFLCVGEVQKNNKCTYGQLPHHFVGDTPTFLALSGATQTGPNTFWVKSALQYARNSGNTGWLKGYMPTLRAAAAFCFDLINPENHLLLAPGSLMIDVFIRQNYTSDSNAMMVGFLNEFADAEAAVGNATGATVLRARATAMANAVNAHMWDTDHFVTQVNPDDMGCAQTHSCRDFVDYDSNLIAVAHGIASATQARAVLHRIDTGIQKCTAMRGGGPQWTSEIWYGKKDTTSGNIGDSSSAMGRIAWFDGKARKVVGDVESFNTQIGLMQRDLLRDTWMHERYGCDGKQQANRTAAYFEYPSTVAILLREIRYGIELGFDRVHVDPMPNSPFHYHIGNVDIDYAPNGTTTVAVPPSGAGGADREFRFTGMAPASPYAVSADAACPAARRMATTATFKSVVQSDPHGVLQFRTFGHCGVSITPLPL